MTVTVLLVDDSKLARIVAGKAIAALRPDWLKIEAGNAEEALRIVDQQQVDVAVLDFNMPDKDGLELAAELRQKHPDMPIAVITANVQDEIISRVRALNATFVGKPVTEEAIRGFISGGCLAPQDGWLVTDGILLDELEQDALTELVNIGVSRAAASLRKMVAKQVLLSVPAVEVVTRKSAAALIGQRESEELIAVQQDFEGPFSGRALLIFPQSNGLKLARAILGDEMGEDEIAEMESEALAETGNVILNGCLGSIANMLQKSLKMSLPHVRRGNSEKLFEVHSGIYEGGFVLFLYINFSVRDHDIRGYIAMIMDLPSLEILKQLISAFIERVTGDTP